MTCISLWLMPCLSKGSGLSSKSSTLFRFRDVVITSLSLQISSPFSVQTPRVFLLRAGVSFEFVCFLFFEGCYCGMIAEIYPGAVGEFPH